jgi:Spy/CpxP family protein refolding chaperone
MERAMGPGGPGGPGEHGRWWNEPRAIEKLKLTETQRKSMDDIYQKNRLNLVDLHANLEKAELVMEPLMQDEQPDETKILSQIDKIAQARAELEKANARMLLGLRKQLTPDQWKQIQAERSAHREGREGGPGRDGRDGAGPDREQGRKWHGKGTQNAPQGGGPGSGPGQSTPPPPPGPSGDSGPDAEE